MILYIIVDAHIKKVKAMLGIYMMTTNSVYGTSN